MAVSRFNVRTGNRTELVDITDKVGNAVRNSKVDNGVCIVYVPHTTAAVTINENADPSVKRDILMELNKTIPFNDGYSHMEGNSAAHIKSTLVGASVQIPVENGRLTLGTWQGIFFCEFDGPRNRSVIVQIIGK